MKGCQVESVHYRENITNIEEARDLEKEAPPHEIQYIKSVCTAKCADTFLLKVTNDFVSLTIPIYHSGAQLLSSSLRSIQL